MSLLQEIALDLVRDGLVKNKNWVPVACERAGKLFAGRDLQMAATFLAALHPFAIDYIEQAPALVVAAVGHRRLDIRSERLRIANRFIVACSTKRRLRDVMAHYGLAPQLRAIDGRALRQQHLPLLKLFIRFPAVEVAQNIPRDLEQQAGWLDATLAWANHMERYAEEPSLLLGWAMRKLRTPAYVPEIARFAEELGRDFNRDWSEQNAKRACERLLLESLERHQRGMIKAGEPIWGMGYDVAPFPTTYTMGDFAFLAIESLGALELEARAMHHCVWGYGNRARSKISRLFSVLRNGRRIATLDVGEPFRGDASRCPVFVITQIRSYWNIHPSAEVVDAAQAFVDEINAEAGRSYVAGQIAEVLETRRRVLGLVLARAA